VAQEIRQVHHHRKVAMVEMEIQVRQVIHLAAVAAQVLLVVMVAVAQLRGMVEMAQPHQ
jgi:hypothetical protein